MPRVPLILRPQLDDSRLSRPRCVTPGVDPEDWTPRDLRHSFVSILSQSGVPIEEISRLMGGHAGTAVTELVYRHELRPVLQAGAGAMDLVFPHLGTSAGSVSSGKGGLLAKPTRKAKNVSPSQTGWAQRDSNPPDSLLVRQVL